MSLLGAATLLICIAASAVAGPLEDGMAAAERGDYATASWLLRPLAEHGDSVAQFDLGFLYDTGHGGQRDYGEAAKWYRLAAEQGHAVAQYQLGSMYANGRGVPRDYAEAAKWYRRAAQQGYAWAQFYLGVAFTNGEGVPKIFTLAHMWLSLAASSRYEPPLGSLHAMNDNERRAVANLATGARSKLEAQMDDDEIADAQKLATEWKPELWRR
jgi:TPR repeat protein